MVALGLVDEMTVSLKVPGHLAEQDERLIGSLQNEAASRSKGFQYKPAHVLVMALQNGLERMERELAEIDKARTDV